VIIPVGGVTSPFVVSWVEVLLQAIAAMAVPVRAVATQTLFISDAPLPAFFFICVAARRVVAMTATGGQVVVEVVVFRRRN